MHISEIYIYPIKSLRGISLATATLTAQGLQYDRRFMLFKDTGKLNVPDTQRFESMHVGSTASMALFETKLELKTAGEERIVVVFHRPARSTGVAGDVAKEGSGTSDERDSIAIPLLPDTSELSTMDVDMYHSSCRGHVMPSHYSAWFSAHFGFPVVLVYAGTNLRPVLGNLAPNAAQRNPARAAQRARESAQSANNKSGGWLGSIPVLSTLWSTPSSENDSSKENPEDYYLSFSDMSPYLIVSAASVDDLSSRLPPSVAADVTKFRPNFVVAGASQAWDEDYWGALTISPSSSFTVSSSSSSPQAPSSSSTTSQNPITLTLTANCVRCASVTVDYATGEFGTGKDGDVFKKLQKDRRVDKGVPYSPAFGRYGFLSRNSGQGVNDGDAIDGNRVGHGEVELNVRVGDGVVVSKRNEERTVVKWPGFGKTAEEEWFPV